MKTPRTDAACGFHDLETAVSADFARQLEIEIQELHTKLNVRRLSVAEKIAGFKRLSRMPIVLSDEQEADLKKWRDFVSSNPAPAN